MSQTRSLKVQLMMITRTKGMRSLHEANNQGEEDEAVTEMEEMFLRLVFSQAVVLKLVDDQGIDYPWTLASL